LNGPITAFAPGRVNLVGEHTDYNDGLALPFAIAEGVTVRAKPATGSRIEAHARDFDQADAFELGRIEPTTGWRAFVRGVAAELQRTGRELSGATLDITGTLQRGVGLSSSAAFAVAVALALTALCGEEDPDRIELARLCSRVEHDWVGARTGLLDQLASLFGAQERAVAIDFRSLQIKRVPLALNGYRLVLLDSGESRANTASGYNERRAECARACELLGVASLRDVSAQDAERLPEPLADRARHVIGENARVVCAIDALERCDATELGRVLDAAHVSLRDLFSVSTPAVERARDQLLRGGALGARLVGGGFGGSVLGLLAADSVLPDGAREVWPGPGARVAAARAQSPSA
jgi:galactokinase